nr:hypothetical protein [Rhodococcus sp. (in: high G+C Gram-positive bacteria)]
MTLEDAHAAKILTPMQTWGKPFSGTAEWKPAPRLKFLNPAGTWHYKTETTWVDGEDFFVMHDTSTFPDGRKEFRNAYAKRVAPDRVMVAYDGMASGMEINLRADGFTSTFRYQQAPFPRLLSRTVYVDVVDDNYVGTAGEATRRGRAGFEHLDPSEPVMHDIMSMKWKGREIGQLILRLTHEEDKS